MIYQPNPSVFLAICGIKRLLNYPRGRLYNYLYEGGIAMCELAYEEMLEDCEAELVKIEDLIESYKQEIVELRLMRCKILSKMRDIDIGIILECIEDNGLKASDMIEPIMDVVRRKAFLAGKAG